MPKHKKTDNVLYKIGEIEIRKINFINLKLGEHEYARLAKASLLSGLPISKLIALSAQPCNVCGNDQVHISINLGMLSTKKQMTGSGRNCKINELKPIQ
jgi:hypothetical protein